MTECIHGLELSRCDVCSPKSPPKATTKARQHPAAPARARTRPRQHTTGTPQALGRRPLNLGEQRIHHITHLNNLPGILRDGALLADANETWECLPAVDISSADNRTRRRGTPAGTGSVADYVPFYLSPNALLWEAIRAGSRDSRLSPAAAVPPAEFVVLVSTIEKTTAGRDDPHDIVVSDRDAADPLARLTTLHEDRERVLYRMLASPDAEPEAEPHGLLQAEFLVRHAVALESFALIGVANDKAREQVRTILGTSGFQPRIAVHPPWFSVPEQH